MSVLGLSWPTDKGEWLPLVSGRPLARNHFEIIVDKTLGFQLHETIKLGKETYTVVGITSGMVSSGGDGMGIVTVSDSQAIQFDSVGEALRLERSARERRSTEVDIFQHQPQLVEQLANPASELPAVSSPAISAVIARVAPGANMAQAQEVIASWGDVSVFSKSGQEDLLLQDGGQGPSAIGHVPCAVDDHCGRHHGADSLHPDARQTAFHCLAEIARCS
jgi:putative ABC transport system permease protein